MTAVQPTNPPPATHHPSHFAPHQPSVLRLVVDGRPYRHTSAASDGNLRKTVQHRGQLVLELAAGSHTVVLQWASFYDEAGVSWTTINQVLV